MRYVTTIYLKTTRMGEDEDGKEIFAIKVATSKIGLFGDGYRISDEKDDYTIVIPQDSVHYIKVQREED